MSNCFPAARSRKAARRRSETDPLQRRERHFPADFAAARKALFYKGFSYAQTAYDTCNFGSCRAESSPLDAGHRTTATLVNSRSEDKDMAAFDTTRTTYGSTGLFGRIGALISSAAGAIAAWNDARATRNVLSGLTDRELADIGLCRGDIDTVAAGKSVF